MKAICTYCNRSEATILQWIRGKSFPACKITGSWESDQASIDAWRIDQIENSVKNGYHKKLVNRKNK
jgi:predicted DNA-binding transcriptional regulator AlpA